MKKLNFFPYYEHLIRIAKKTTTLRLDNRNCYGKEDKVEITIGWDEAHTLSLGKGVIKAVYRKKLLDLNNQDLEGESPDCQTLETSKLVLSCIYRRVLADEDSVWVIKFKYL